MKSKTTKVLAIVPPNPSPEIGNFMDILVQALTGAEDILLDLSAPDDTPAHQRFVNIQETAKLRGRRR
jgi:hypothetical protein